MIEYTTSSRRRLILVGLALLVVGWVVWKTRGALMPFALGAVLAYLFAPLVEVFERFLPRRGRLGAMARPSAIILTYLTALAILAGAGLYVVPPLVDQTSEFVESMPSYVEDVRNQSADLRAYYERTMPEPVRQQVEGNLDAVGAQAANAVRAAMVITFNAVGSFLGFAAGLLLLPLWLFYVLKDQSRGMDWFYNIWPEAWRADVRRIVGMVDDVLSAYIRGQLLLGVIIGVVTGLAMWLIGINQSLVLGLFAGIFELIPVLGPWLAFVVAALVTLATEPDRILLVAIAFLAIQQLENTFLVPKIQGDAVRLHPAVVMMLLVVGGSLWGIVGMIVIVPVTAVARDVFVYLYDRLGKA